MPENIRFHSFPIQGVEAMTASSRRSFPRHTHDQYGIGVIDAGRHSSWSGKGQVEAGPRNFICVNPGEAHDGHAPGGRGRSWRMLYFSPQVMERARTDILGASESQIMFCAPVFEDQQLRPLFEAAFSHRGAAQPRDDVSYQTDVLRLIARLLHHATGKTPREVEPAGCIRRARQRIDDDPARSHTLAELAKGAGLSRYQLLRSFAQELGLTPHAYIMQRRIAHAQRLIKAGHNLVEVATASGFYDQSHLIRCFVRQLGTTPRRYAEVTFDR
jgi:AraC-like DNA-binding protein